MLPILVTLTSRSDSNFERSNISLKENKWDGVDPNYNGLKFCVRKIKGKILRVSADCTIIKTGRKLCCIGEQIIGIVMAYVYSNTSVPKIVSNFEA